jgi:lysophospholipase L1-like esterase
VATGQGRLAGWARRAGLLAASLLLCGLLLEGGARLALRGLGAPLQLGWQAGDGAEAGRVRDLLYLPDRELFFRLAPELDLAETGNPRIFDLRTNSLGLRNDEVSLAKPPGTWRVLALGDSCTFGSGAGQADTWPAQLERRLAAARSDLRFEVLNAGVPGWSSHQALRYLEREGLAFEPDAVILASGVNDASPATAGAKRRFAAGRQLSDREYAAALGARRRLALAELLWRAGLLSAPVGAGAGDAPGGVKRRVSPSEYFANLAAFAAASRARGALPVVAFWPLRSEAAGESGGEVEEVLREYKREAAAAARSAGVPFVDLKEVLRGRPDLYVDPVHLAPEGYGRVAERLAAELAAHLPAP